MEWKIKFLWRSVESVVHVEEDYPEEPDGYEDVVDGDSDVLFVFLPSFLILQVGRGLANQMVQGLAAQHTTTVKGKAGFLGQASQGAT